MKTATGLQRKSGNKFYNHKEIDLFFYIFFLYVFFCGSYNDINDTNSQSYMYACVSKSELYRWLYIIHTKLNQKAWT